MKRLMGFALFFFAMGMLFMLIIGNEFWGFILIAVCLLAGYNIFCCKS